MSRKGNCWDNACGGIVFSLSEDSVTHHCKFETFLETKQALFNYIEGIL
jgi:hypothetical protein